jgi:hypothetical protein
MTSVNVIVDTTVINVTPVTTTVTVSPVISTITQAFPAGIKGDKGLKGDSGESVVYTAPSEIITSPIGGNKVIAVLNGLIVPADSSDLNFLGKVIGLTSGATTTGQSSAIVTSGVLNGFSNLIAGDTYFLGISGSIINTIPTVGFIQQIGTAITVDLLVVSIQQPIQII